jgi:hypothetical protein
VRCSIHAKAISDGIVDHGHVGWNMFPREQSSFYEEFVLSTKTPLVSSLAKRWPGNGTHKKHDTGVLVKLKRLEKHESINMVIFPPGFFPRSPSIVNLVNAPERTMIGQHVFT